LSLSSLVDLPCGETPDIGVPVAASYLKPKNRLRSCFGLNGKLLLILATSEIVRDYYFLLLCVSKPGMHISFKLPALGVPRF
jgi:hypothetical protein